MIVFDAGAFRELARLYAPGQSWLNMVEDTSNLGTVKNVVLPSVVGDMELRGRVYRVRNAGENLVWANVNRNLQNITLDVGRYFDVFNHCLSHASRRFHTPDGPQWHAGKHGIEIRDTAEGRKLMNDTLVTVGSAAPRGERLQAAREPYRGKHKGDDDVIDAIREMDHDGPLFVVLTDHGLARRLMSEGVRTRTGKVPRIYTVEQYLEAEHHARRISSPSFPGKPMQLPNEAELPKFPTIDALRDIVIKGQRWSDRRAAEIDRLQHAAGAYDQDLEAVISEGIAKRTSDRTVV